MSFMVKLSYFKCHIVMIKSDQPKQKMPYYEALYPSQNQMRRGLDSFYRAGRRSHTAYQHARFVSRHFSACLVQKAC